jgi:hypothetical protein
MKEKEREDRKKEKNKPKKLGPSPCGTGIQ